MLTPLEVFPWNITPMQHGAHFFNDISATGSISILALLQGTEPTIQTYNANLQYKHTIQTYNTKPAVQTCNTNLQYRPKTKTYNTNIQCKTYNTNLQYTPCNTDLQCKPAIHTYNRNLRYKPTTQTSKQNLHRDMSQTRYRRGIEAGKLESVSLWLGRRGNWSIDR